jgi:ABC-type uncharacterized transport system substrate-binding protein
VKYMTTGRHAPPRGGYADRMLKVEKPRELPVQATVKLELVINLEIAAALVSRRRQVR